jgi:RNA polymerase sigma factor (sigma-70 family)
MAMRNDSRADVLQAVGTLFHLGTTWELTDVDLLDRFISGEGELASAAFEVIVYRHGEMVFNVCRNALRDLHDAEDAFQATFLILARQARSIRKQSSMASWLFGVASRVAARARSDAARRRLVERTSAEMAAARESTADDHAGWALLHEAIASLPEKYRDPIVLCDLEGLTYQAAAERLGCPVGTVSVRLMRARARVRDRLLRRGELTAAGLPCEPSATREPRAVSPALIAATVQHASGFFSRIGPATGYIPIHVANHVEAVSLLKVGGIFVHKNECSDS